MYSCTDLQTKVKRVVTRDRCLEVRCEDLGLLVHGGLDGLEGPVHGVVHGDVDVDHVGGDGEVRAGARVAAPGRRLLLLGGVVVVVARGGGRPAHPGAQHVPELEVLRGPIRAEYCLLSLHQPELTFMA